MRVHYHDGAKCFTPQCAESKDRCGFEDAAHGQCTLDAGHPVDCHGDPGGHLFFVKSVAGQGEQATVDPEVIAGRRLAAALTGEPFDALDLGDVLGMGRNPLGGAQTFSDSRGIPSITGTGERAPTADSDGFSDPSPEEIERAFREAGRAMQAIRTNLRNAFVRSADASTLVRALIERARSEARDDTGEPLDAVIDELGEHLRMTGLFTPDEITVVCTVAVCVLQREPSP